MIQRLIEKLNLQPHPEGGYFAETYRSDISVTFTPKEGLGGGEVPGPLDRSASTAIYFLVCPGKVSRLHRILSDEVWHFYLGGPLNVVTLDINEPSHYKITTLGSDILDTEQQVQFTVPANTWFGCFPGENSEFSLVGCTVAPGFDFVDFELASRSKLLEEFPNAKDVIVKLTEGLP
jgi:predicted cupin superfamily sugar epimerase